MAARRKKGDRDDLDEVYLGDFEGFVKRRDALAKKLRSDGDSDEADRVKALKKPSRTAWAVNQFAEHGGKARTELLKAGEQLRAASDALVGGDGDREAMIKARDRERAAVAAALDAIAALADESGAALSGAAAERVRQTLHAVALEDEVRSEFEAARLTADHEATGLGAVPAGGGRATAKGKGKAGTKGKARERQAAERRRKELKAAEAEAVKRTRELEAAALELDEAKAAAKRAEGDLKRASKAHERARVAAEKADAKVAGFGEG